MFYVLIRFLNCILYEGLRMISRHNLVKIKMIQQNMLLVKCEKKVARKARTVLVREAS